MPSSVLLLALAGTSHAAEDKPPPIDLTFAWSEPFEVRVTGTRELTRSPIGGTSTTATFSFDQRLSASPHDGGVQALAKLPLADSWELAETGEADPVRHASLIAEYGSFPGFVLDDRGDFQRLHPAQGVADPLVVRAEGDPALLGARLQDLLAGTWSGLWSEMIGVWNGLRFRVGSSYGGRGNTDFLGIGRLDVVREYTLVDQVPCAEGEAESRCVELRLREFPDTEAMRETTESWAKEIAGSQVAGGTPPLLEHEVVVTVVAEPGTLKPHRLVRHQVSSVELVDAKGQTWRGARTDDLTLTFAYSTPAP